MLDPKTLCRSLLLLCALSVSPHLCPSTILASTDVQSEGAMTGIDQTDTIKRLNEENAKLKLALSDAKVENANLRTEIDVLQHREKFIKNPTIECSWC